MAFCPQCGQPMQMLEPICPYCGHDSCGASDYPSLRRRGFAYSTAANLALLASTVATGLACLVAAVGAVSSLVQGDLERLIPSSFAFVLLAGLMVAFARVSYL